MELCHDSLVFLPTMKKREWMNEKRSRRLTTQRWTFRWRLFAQIKHIINAVAPLVEISSTRKITFHRIWRMQWRHDRNLRNSRHNSQYYEDIKLEEKSSWTTHYGLCCTSITSGLPPKLKLLELVPHAGILYFIILVTWSWWKWRSVLTPDKSKIDLIGFEPFLVEAQR